MAEIHEISEKGKELYAKYYEENTAIQNDSVVLAGKRYVDVTYANRPVNSAYIQCSWFSPKQMKFMEEGLKALGLNPTISLRYSHHPLSHQYKDINVEEHPEVMDDLEWQQATSNMDVEAMKRHPFGVGLFMPSEPDEGQGFEQGYLYATHKPNLLVIPKDETKVPINLMMIKNTQIITIDKLQEFDFNTDLIYKPYRGKVF